jgi:phage gp16-like protein
MNKITAQLATRELHWNYAHAVGKRMFKIERLEWLNDAQLYKVMQALQIDQNRQGTP